MLTRRGLLSGVVALGAAATASGPAAEGAGAAAGAATQSQLLAELLKLEGAMAYAYEKAVGSDAPGPALKRVLALVLEHERAHLEVLSAAAGAQPRLYMPADRSAAQAVLSDHHLSRSLASLRSEHDWLAFLAALEAAAEAAYYKAISKISAPALLRTAAEILASEAQHSAMLGQRLHPTDIGKAIPDAFVQGPH